MPDGNAESPVGVEDIFKGIMSQFHVTVNILRMNERSMEYDVHLGEEIVLPCVGAITLNDEGKVTEYIIRPR